MGQAHNPKGFRPADPTIKPQYHPEAAAQSFVRGDMTYLVSGLVTVAGAATATLLGPAAADASGTTDNPVPVYSRPNTVFIGRANGATALLDGAEIDLVGASGAMEIDEDASSTDVLVCINEIDTDEVATAAGKEYRVIINPAKHQLQDAD